MRIDRIHLKNYRCFADLPVAFDSQMTVLIAPNGQGKTTVLDAIKVALWPYVAGFDMGSTTNDTTSIHLDDIRREPIGTHKMVWRIPSEIQANGQLQVRQLIVNGSLKISNDQTYESESGDVPWQSLRYRESVKKGTKTKDRNPPFNALNISTTAKILQQRIFSDAQIVSKPDTLPMLGYYGTGRLWAQRKLTVVHEKSDNETRSRTFSYRDCLDPASSYKHFVAWFSRIHQSYFQAQIRNLVKGLPPDADVPDELIAPFHAVQRAVNTILKAHTGWHTLEYSADHEELVLNHDQQGILKASQFSDGIRNMLALVGDIAYRCYKLNAHLGEHAPRLTHGIVMIDEVDMHLHPGWQQTVLTDLMTAFPKLQFIVTTHSPHVLSTVRSKNIRIIGPDASGAVIASQPIAMSYGEPSGDVLHSVMMIDPQPPIPEKEKLLRLTELVDQGDHDTPEAQDLNKSLTETLGIRHPQIQRLQRSINRQKALNQ